MKKRIFALCAVLVLIALCVIPVMAYPVINPTPQSGYGFSEDMDDIYGRSEQWNTNFESQDRYLFVIDLYTLCSIAVEDEIVIAEEAPLDFFYGTYKTVNNQSNMVLDEFELYPDYIDGEGIVQIDLDINGSTIASIDPSTYGSNNEERFFYFSYTYLDGDFYQYESMWASGQPIYQTINLMQLSNSGQYTTGYSAGETFGRQRGYEEGYEAGYNTGLETGREENDFGNAGSQLIVTAVETPFNVLSQWLDFEVLGVNLLGILMSVLTIIIVVAVIKAIL